ncbi:ABC transporter substrate-binding protein [Actinoallomurus liliacearum]|uniref:ABC transporter substrate-binding protein n=1 Tax=Actinoallomurus liliacearum TaxID=1080073 RepID=A0ABP8TCL9_9ACTN
MKPDGFRWNKPVAAAVIAVMCAGLGACSSSGGSTSAGGASPASAPTPVARLVNAAKSEKGLVIYGNAPTQYLQPVMNAFGKQYPGIKVTETDLSDNQVFSKYEAEAAQGARTADLVFASAPASWLQAEQNGVPANVTPTGLENFPADTNQGHGVFVMSPEPILQTHNSKLLTSAQVPTTYAQLAADSKADPAKYKLVSYPIDNPLAYAAVYGMIHVLGADKVWSYFDAIAPNTKTYNEGLDGLQQIIQGGASVGYITSGLAQGVLPKYKGLAGYTFMKDVTPLIPRAIAVTAKASSPASAQLFLDFLYSKAGQDALCAGGFEASMNNYEPAGGCTASLTNLKSQVPAGTVYTVPIDQQVLNAQAGITRRWNQSFHR